jgi:hypothetical protein
MKFRKPIVRAVIEGRSWFAEKGLYAFEATVDGEAAEVHVSEDIAFDLLGVSNASNAKCLDVLRLHRAALATNLQRKLDAVGHPDDRGFYFLTLHDIERTNPIVRDQEREDRSERDLSEQALVIDRRKTIRWLPERPLVAPVPPIQPPSARPRRPSH